MELNSQLCKSFWFSHLFEVVVNVVTNKEEWYYYGNKINEVKMF